MGSGSLTKAGASGFLFGAALAISGVFTPAVVLAQMRLEDWHMVKVFLSATAGSALVVNALPSMLPSLSIRRPSARQPTTLKLFSAYDGNILGGLAIGAGMAIAGACPGTVFVQIGAGLRSGLTCLAGGVAGAVIYGLVVEGKLHSESSAITNGGSGQGNAAISNEALDGDGSSKEDGRGPNTSVGKSSNSIATSITTREGDAAPTVNALLGTSAFTTLAGFEALLVSALAAVHFLFDSPTSTSTSNPSLSSPLSSNQASSSLFSPLTASGALSPIYGGLLITLAQAGSLLLTERPLGASGIYSDISRWILQTTSTDQTRSHSNTNAQQNKSTATHQAPSLLITNNLAFTTGVMLGGYLIAHFLPGLALAAARATTSGPAAISDARSFLGGALLAFGARTARGCTSGHGISGLASLGVASALSVGCMFVAGFGVGALV